MVYQPNNIIDNTIEGVEILLRWDRGDKEPVGPDRFIKIAEEISLLRR